MKKALAIVLILVTALVSLTACSRTDSVGTSEEEVKFLTFSDEKFEYQTELKTAEGVTFSCAPHYVMSGKAVSGLSRSIPIAVFSLEKEYLEENEYKSDQMELDFELSSNSKIVMIQYLDYEKQIIATKKLSSNVVTIPQDYQDVYVDEVVIFVENNGKTYQAIFARTGA